MQTTFKKGDLVQSTYRAFWIGKVVNVEVIRRKNHAQELYQVQQLFTYDGRPQRLKRIITSDGHWLREVPKQFIAKQKKPLDNTQSGP